jgi:trimethylamine:corrinoid methyltransferase-like protein
VTLIDPPRRRNRHRTARLAAAETPGRAVIGTAAAYSAANLPAIEADADLLLSEVGISCHLPEAAANLCRKAGLIVTSDRVRFPAQRTPELIARAPRNFTHLARAAERSLDVSTRLLAFGPSLSGRHIWRGHQRTPLSLIDVEATIRAAEAFAQLEYGPSSLALMAVDGNAAQRLSLFARGGVSPLIAPSGTPFHTCDLIRAATAQHPSGEMSCHLMMVGSIDSALTFNAAFIEALVETARHAQGFIVAPTILIGSNAPATIDGTVLRFAAEARAACALSQALRPGQPFAVGATILDVSLRTGLPLTGSAKALTALAATIALARHWNLAYYATAPATSAKGFDALSTAETSRWITAAYHLGANAVLGALGAVDLDCGISIEKLIVDGDVAAALGRAQPADPAGALEALRTAGAGANFLATEATRQAALAQPIGRLTTEGLFENWVAAGAPTLADTLEGMIQGLPKPAPLAIDAQILPTPTEITLHDRQPHFLADLACSLYSRSMSDAFGFSAN